MFDTDTVIESLEAQPWTVMTLRSFAPSAKLSISPLTLRPRTSSKIVCKYQMTHKRNFDYDQRQASLFFAAWTAASMKNLFEIGVDSVTAFELAGSDGMIGPPPSNLIQEYGISDALIVYPIFHIIADLMEMRGGSILPSDKLRDGTGSIRLATGDLTRIIIFNLGEKPRKVRLERLPSREIQILRLNEETAIEAMTHPMSFRQSRTQIEIHNSKLETFLRPFEVVRLDSQNKARNR